VNGMINPSLIGGIVDHDSQEWKHGVKAMRSWHAECERRRKAKEERDAKVAAWVREQKENAEKERLALLADERKKMLARAEKNRKRASAYRRKNASKKLTHEELSAIRKAAAKAYWEKRRKEARR